MNNLLSQLQLIQPYELQTIWSIVVISLYIVITRLTLPKIEKSVNRSRFKSESTDKAYHTVRLVSALVVVVALLLIWGIDFSGVLILSTSLLTLTGVALFANWSLLSNITSYMVLLFHSSYRRGVFLRIIDGDNYIEGYIADIGLFSAKLITEDREVVIYPNNLLVTRPTLINPRTRLNGLGKISGSAITKMSPEQ